MENPQNEEALRSIMAQVEKVSSFAPPWAPGMTLTAGLLGPETCASCHRDFTASQAGMAGEAAEILAQNRPVLEVIKADAKLCPKSLTLLGDGPDHVAGKILFTGKSMAVPAVLCFRQAAGHRGGLCSPGCAAAPDEQTAVHAGIFEVIEYGVMTAWWRGMDILPRAINHPPSRLTHLLAPDIKAARAGLDARVTELALITSICGVHAVAAWSFDSIGDGGFVVASAAHCDLREAGRSALRELCQLEWGLHLARIKQQQAGLVASDFDRKVMARSDCISRDDPRLLMDDFLPEREPDSQDLLGRLNNSFSTCVDVTLHAQAGLHVHKIIIPELYCTQEPFH